MTDTIGVVRHGEFSEMLQLARPGDQLFQWNTKPLSYLIEEFTERTVNGKEEPGPSHVIQLANFPAFSDEMYHFEAVFPEGCRLLPLSHYAQSTSRMLLCRRKGWTERDTAIASGVGLACLGRKYEVPEEIEIAIRKIAPWVHVSKTDNSFFCSGYVHHMDAGTSVPYAQPPEGNATPEFLLRDAGNEYVFWVN